MEESKSVVVVSVLEYLIECDYDYQSPTYPLCFGVYGDKLKAENAVWRCFENDSFGEGYVTWMSYEEFRSLGVHFFTLTTNISVITARMVFFCRCMPLSIMIKA